VRYNGRKMYRHSETGLELPDTIGTYKQGQIGSYPTSSGQTGVAIPFHAPGAEGTVFIRPLAPRSPETASDLIEENLNLVKAMEANGKYSAVTTYRSSGVDERPGWERAGFTTNSNDSILVSLIFCSVQRGYAFKVRVTARNLTEEVKAFVAAVQKLIDQAPA
jgi:hypothetical protein